MSIPSFLELAEHALDPVVRAGIRRHDFVRVRFLEAIDPLTDEQLHWRPGSSQARPIALILDHIGSAATNYRRLFTGEGTDAGLGLWQDPNALATYTRRPLAFYRENILAVYDRLVEAYLRATPEMLAREVMLRSGRSITGEMLLFHATEHLYYHTGQINYITMLPGFPV
ncbi:MAG: hypothetical protein C4289_03180 [Chloroflexota bacterium]